MRQTWKTLAYFCPASTAVRTSGSVKVCGTFEGNRCLLRVALLRRTSLLLFIHNLSSSSTSLPSSIPPVLHIRAPVSFPVTVALTIRSVSGLFKAFGTLELPRFVLWPTCMGKRQNFGDHVVKTGPNTRRHITRRTSCCVLEEVSKVFCMKYLWVRVASQPSKSRVCWGYEGQLSLTAPFTHMRSPDGSNH